MREYETVYILDPAMTDADVKHSMDRTSEIINRHSGHIFRSINMGKKSLAYRIKKQSKGFYVSFDYSGDNTLVSELERGFKLDERVLRYLTVKLSDDVDVEARKKQIMEEAEALAKAAELSSAPSKELDMKQPGYGTGEEVADA